MCTPKQAFVLIITLVTLNCQSQASNDTLFKGRADIILNPVFGVYYVNLPSTIYLSNSALTFIPRHNTEYISVFTVSLDSVMRIKKVYAGIKIQTKNGAIHHIRVPKKRKEFFDLLQTRIKTEPGKIRKTKKKTQGVNPDNKSHRVKQKIVCLGSTFFSPLLVNGQIENTDSSIIFTPLQYTDYVKRVEIPKSQMKWIEKKGPKKIIIGLKNGIQYTFKSDKNRLLFKELEAHAFTL